MFAAAAALVAIQAAPTTDAADLALTGLRHDPYAVAIARVQGESRLDVQESAPQEQVVNGLETNDLLEIVANRQGALPDTIASRPVDNRVPLLLMILVFSLAWYAVTLPPSYASRGRNGAPTSSGAPLPSDQEIVRDALDARTR